MIGLLSGPELESQKCSSWWKNKHGGATVLKTSVWNNTVCNYIRQKTGEIEDYKTLAIGAQKWCKEHIPRNGNDLTEEGQILLEDPEL